MTSMHVVVGGLVQGVGFRYSSRAEAQRLGIGGWVRNRDDGAVEAVITGEEELVQQMLRWLSHGPNGADVRSVEATPIEAGSSPDEGDSTFRILG